MIGGNIITLNVYKQLCEENEYFAVFKTLIDAYSATLGELIDIRDDYTSLCFRLRENNYYIKSILEQIVDASPHLNNISINLPDTFFK